MRWWLLALAWLCVGIMIALAIWWYYAYFVPFESGHAAQSAESIVA